MIYQCCYLPQHEAHIAVDPRYFGVCLQPESLDGLPAFDIRSTPPLGEPAIRQQLCEYAAMLAVWRQRPHPDSWVGFTSWRQFFKGFDFRFDEEALRRVLGGETICWGMRTLQESLHAHAERCHPGLTGVLAILLREVHGESLPDGFFSERTAPFSNYWAMRWEDFERYMHWSWPVVETALVRWGLDQPYNLYPRGGTQDRALAFLQERLFIVWWLSGRIARPCLVTPLISPSPT